jgi:hypothetical protein
MNAGRQMIANLGKRNACRKTFVVTVMAVLAMFALDNIGSLVRRDGLSGNLANAQSLAEPEDESSADADGVTPDVVNNVAGTWSGPITDSVAGDGTLMLTIKQKANASALKGTFTYMFPSITKSGTLKGNEKNGVGMIELIHKSHHHPGTCVVKSAITVPDATHMNATFMTTGNCAGSTGTFNLTMP